MRSNLASCLNLTRERGFVHFWYFFEDSSDRSQILPKDKIRCAQPKSRKKLPIFLAIWYFKKRWFFSTSYYNVIEIVLTYRFWANSSLLWNIPYPDFPIQTPRHKKRVLFRMKGYTFYSFRMNKLEKTIFFC